MLGLGLGLGVPQVSTRGRTDDNRVMVMLVDPNDGLALQAPTGEAWVQWVTNSMAVLVDPNDGLALQAPTGETWVQWITVTNNV